MTDRSDEPTTDKMGFDSSSIDKSQFVRDYRNELKTQLETKISRDERERVPLMTEIVIESIAAASVKAISSQTWQSNEPVTVDVSAHKETKLIREKIRSNPELKNVQISACLGGNMDVQVRIGDTVIVNAESELGSSRQRADDLAKLTSHTHKPIVSTMVSRGKSEKDVERIRKNLSNKAEKCNEPFVGVTLYWRNDDLIKNAKVIMDTINDPNN